MDFDCGGEGGVDWVGWRDRSRTKVGHTNSHETTEMKRKRPAYIIINFSCTIGSLTVASDQIAVLDASIRPMRGGKLEPSTQRRNNSPWPTRMALGIVKSRNELFRKGVSGLNTIVMKSAHQQKIQDILALPGQAEHFCICDQR